MEGINLIGLAAALATFGGVWLGHVAVRRIEFRARDIRLPMALFVMLGLALLVFSSGSYNPSVSGACGILGITCLWDALEFIRQQKRVRRGHAPANPANPRHARFLAENPSVTTEDLLKREPLPY